MERSSHREVVLEIEQVKIIRKRAKTTLRYCRGCKATTDFISVQNAADLFSTTAAGLFEFTQSCTCHYRVEQDQNILLCLTDLLSAMSSRMRTGSVKLLEESK